MAVIPLSSQSDAAKAIEHAKQSSKDDKNLESNESQPNIDSSTESEVEDQDLSTAASPDPESYHYSPVEEPSGDGSTVAEDVIEKKGLYGRFAKQWFSRQGWVREKRMAQGMSRKEPDDAAYYWGPGSYDSQRSDMLELDDFSIARRRSSTVGSAQGGKGNGDGDGDVTKAASSPSPSSSPPVESDTRTYELMPKFLRYTKMMFSSRSFYFSYDHDITRRFGATEDQPSPSIPLFRRADPLVWSHFLLGFKQVANTLAVLLESASDETIYRGWTPLVRATADARIYRTAGIHC